MTNPRPPLTPAQVKELQAAQQLLQAGNAKGAIGRIRPLLAAGLVHADAYALFGAACRADGLVAEARTSLNAAVNLDSANPRFWAALADLLVASGDLAAARVASQRVTILLPDDSGATLALADVLLQQADGDAAEAPLRAVLMREPANIRARHALALALRMQDRIEEAVEVTAAIVADGDAPMESETLHGHLLGDLGQWRESEAAYRSVLARAPAHIDAQDTLARLLPQLGRGEEALAAYAEAIAAQPADKRCSPARSALRAVLALLQRSLTGLRLPSSGSRCGATSAFTAPTRWGLRVMLRLRWRLWSHLPGSMRLPRRRPRTGALSVRTPKLLRAMRPALPNLRPMRRRAGPILPRLGGCWGMRAGRGSTIMSG